MDSLEAVIRRGKETKNLDYKAGSAWNEADKKACCELVKDVLAFANSGGGFIVLGVRDSASGFTLQGMDEQQAATFETSRLNRFIQNYADPPINCTIVKKVIDTAVYVVIEVPGFPETPHICQKDYPNVLQAACLYVRTDNNESAPLRSSSDFRGLIELAVRNRADRLLESFRAILTAKSSTTDTEESNVGYEAELQNVASRAIIATRYSDAYGDSRYNGYRQMYSYPSGYVADRISLANVRKLAKNASVEYRGWPFLLYGEGADLSLPVAVDTGIQCSYKFTDFGNQDRADFWYLGQSGLLLQRVLMWEESAERAEGDPPMLDITELAMYVAEGINAACNVYEPILDPGHSIHLCFQLEGTMGRMLVNYRRSSLSRQYKSSMPQIDVKLVLSLADLRAGIVDHALEVCGDVFERFNWSRPNLNICRKAIEGMFARRLV